MRGFIRIKEGDVKGFVKEEYEVLKELSQNYEELRRKYLKKIYISKPNRVEVWNIPGCGDVVVKWFGWRNRLHFLLSPFMHSKAYTSFKNANFLLAHGISTPEPLAVFTRRRKGFVIENMYITRYIGEHTTLRRALREGYSVETENLLKKAALYVRKMHESGFFHRDLTLENFLMKEGESNFYIVDLNRGRIKKMCLVRRGEDISKMDLNEEEIRIFLDFYGGNRFLKSYVIWRKKLRKLEGKLKKFRKALRSLLYRPFSKLHLH